MAKIKGTLGGSKGCFCKNALILIDLCSIPLENTGAANPPAPMDQPLQAVPTSGPPPRHRRRWYGFVLGVAIILGLGWGLWASAPRFLSSFLTSMLGSPVGVERVVVGWKSLQLEGVFLLGNEQDTLVRLNRISLRWKHLDLTGGTHRLGRLEMDTVVLNILAQPTANKPAATNWDAFWNKLPRGTGGGKRPLKLTLANLHLRVLLAKVVGVGSLGHRSLDGVYQVRDFQITQLRLSDGRWTLNLQTRLGWPLEPGLADLKVRLQGGTGLWKGRGLRLDHPDYHLDLGQVSWQRFSNQKDPEIEVSDLRLSTGTPILKTWLDRSAPALACNLALPKANWNGDRLQVWGANLRLDREISATFQGWYRPNPSVGDPESPQGLVEWSATASTGWESSAERLTATLALLLKNPNLSTGPEAFNRYADLQQGWNGKGQVSLQSDGLSLRSNWRIQSDSLRLDARSDAKRQQWSGFLFCSHYRLPEAMKTPLELSNLHLRWNWGSKQSASASLSLDTLRWDGQPYRLLDGKVAWNKGILTSHINLSDSSNLLEASLSARRGSAGWIACRAQGQMDLAFPALPGWCDGLRARGIFELNYQPPAPNQTLFKSEGDQPWLEWTLKEGGLSCPSHSLVLDQAKVVLSGRGSRTQSTLQINNDSLQTLGLEHWTQIDSVLDQIGRFLLADTLLRDKELPFWAYGRIQNLGDYLPFLKVSDPLQVEQIQGYLNWSSPLNKGLRLSVGRLGWDAWSAQNVSLQSEYLGNHLLVLGSLDSLQLDQGPLLDRIEYRQIRNGSTSTLALNGHNAKTGDLAHFKGTLVERDSLWSLAVDSLRFRSRQQNWKALPGGFIQKSGDRWALETIHLQSGPSMLQLDGLLSKERGDQIRLDLINVDANQVMALTGQGTGWLDGTINGQVTGDGILESPNLSGDLLVSDLRLDSLPLGLLSLRSEFQPEINRLLVNARLQDRNVDLASVAGWVQTDQTDLPCELDLRLQRAPLQLLELVLLPHLDSIRGTARAMVQVKGGLTHPEMSGYLVMDSGRLYLPSIKNTYWISDTVRVRPDGYVFGGNPVRDADFGTAWVTGTVNHRRFRDWTYRFALDSVRNLRVLNEPRLVSGDYYYGLGRVNGNALISGDEYLTNIQVRAQAQKGSRLIIPLDDLDEESRYDFIRFAELNPDTDSSNAGTLSDAMALRGLDLKLSLVLTPESEVTLLLDRRYGDQIKGYGNGALDLTLSQEGNLNLSGNYVFTKGDYSFNLANIASKNFKINNGGRIDWNGDPYEGVMNIQAVYNQRASVQNLLGSSRAQNDRRNMLPVQTQLNLTGPILNPDVKFQLTLPTINMADPNDVLAQQLTRINNNEQELNNQVLGLMVSGQFIPTENINAANLGLSTGATAFNSVTELLTNRLSNLLSNSLGGVNLGINYRGDLGTGLLGSGTGSNSLTDSNRRDLNVALNTSLFNNRLVIDGNLAMGNSLQVNAQNMAGEIQMEYLINPNGTVRARAFNRVDDRILFNQTLNYRQGIGLSYNRNFDRWGELFRSRRSKPKPPVNP